MSDFMHYQARKTETELARAQYGAASTRITLCEIRERAAELRSQHEPLADFVGKILTRDELLELVNYVMVGRRVI
jgi:hypothetical protein